MAEFSACFSSALAPYFENAPIHVQNYSLVYNRVLTNSMTNQLSAGVSYFNQAFSEDAQRDAFKRYIDSLKSPGKREKRPKAMKLAHGGVVAVIKGDAVVAALRAFVAKVAEALRKLEKDGLPPDILPGLMN